jgi:ABC-type branched-subunit amino acid transport system substrate-binding protein
MKKGHLGILTAVVAIGCGGGEEGDATITLGTLMSQTGANGGTGTEQLRGIQLAIDEINAAGGVLGSRLKLFNRDDKSTEEGVIEAANAMIAMKTPAVIGAIASRMTLASAQLTSAAGIVQIAPSSTSPLITAAHATTTPLLHRTCPSDALQGTLLARRARDRGFTKAAVIHVPGAYGKGLADVFAADFVARGGTMTDVVEYVENQQSYVETLTKVFEKSPQALLLVAYNDDAAQLVRDYNTNFSGQQVFLYFTDSSQVESFVQAAGGASGFTFMHEGTGPAAPETKEYTDYQTSFKAKYNMDPTGFSQNAYDAVYLIGAAMEAAGATTGYAGKLREVSAGGTKFGPGKWTELRAAIKAGTDVDYHGASGNVDLDANGDVVAPYDVWKVGSAGQFQVIQRSAVP